MGYYTEHSLTVREIKDKEQFAELEKELKNMGLIGYAFEDGDYHDNIHEAYFGTYDEVKWYEHPEDMVGIAEMFPNMYFMLEGTGEEFGDFWREYYHDMDVESCRGEIIYEQPKKVQWTELRSF